MEQKIYYNKIGMEKIEDLTKDYNPKINYTEVYLQFLKLIEQKEVIK